MENQINKKVLISLFFVAILTPVGTMKSMKSLKTPQKSHLKNTTAFLYNCWKTISRFFAPTKITDLPYDCWGKIFEFFDLDENKKMYCKLGLVCKDFLHVTRTIKIPIRIDVDDDLDEARKQLDSHPNLLLAGFTYKKDIVDKKLDLVWEDPYAYRNASIRYLAMEAATQMAWKGATKLVIPGGYMDIYGPHDRYCESYLKVIKAEQKRKDQVDKILQELRERSFLKALINDLGLWLKPSNQ